jgi:hypothetical protein
MRLVEIEWTVSSPPRAYNFCGDAIIPQQIERFVVLSRSSSPDYATGRACGHDRHGCPNGTDRSSYRRHARPRPTRFEAIFVMTVM